MIVSTIHKAKGREFDDVYMLITNRGHKTDDLMRCYYVGITRAKNRLFIHTDSPYFDQLPTDRTTMDQRLYELPEEVTLQLSHRDVYLDLFKCVKQDVLCLQGGDMLEMKSSSFYNKANNRMVAKISARMGKTLDEWLQRGYYVTEAKVRFVVAWRSKEMCKTEADIAVLLPDLLLKKQASL